MKKNAIDVAYVAQLARLELKPEKVEKLQQDMNRIISYIEELDALDVSSIEPTAHAVPLANVYRDDVARAPFGRVMLDNAPEVIHGETIKVPRVLPGEGSN